MSAGERWGLWADQRGWLTRSYARGVESIACWPSQEAAAAYAKSLNEAYDGLEFWRPARMASL